MKASESGNFSTGHDDRELWSAIRAGDKRGLEEVYRRHVRPLFQYGMGIVRNREIVQDAIHEVFIDIWKYRASIAQTDNVRLYLFRSLSHRIAKAIVKEKRAIDIDEAAAGRLLVSDAFEETLMNSQAEVETRQRLASALIKLPVRQREVIQNIFFENHGYDETSFIMGINVQSVYTLVWKAINSLKKELLVFIFFFRFFQ